MWKFSFAVPFALFVSLHPLHAATLSFDSLVETKKLEAVSFATPLRLNGALTGAGGIDNEFTFKATATEMSLSAGWRTAPDEVRTVGVNIDMFDFLDNLVVTDSFGGEDSGVARSTLTATGLIVGATYRLKLTGTASQNGRYVMNLVDGTVPAPVPAVSVAVTPSGQITFDTPTGTKVYGPKLNAGNSVAVDGRLVAGAFPLLNEFDVTLLGSSLSAGIEWLVDENVSRTLGVNLDVFNFLGDLVGSDAFVGLIDGQAFSQFSVDGLDPGKYTLRFTGNVVTNGRYHIDLFAGTTAPGFSPIRPDDNAVAPVPLPATLPFLAIGLASIGGVGRSRRRQAL